MFAVPATVRSSGKSFAFRLGALAVRYFNATDAKAREDMGVNSRHSGSPVTKYPTASRPWKRTLQDRQTLRGLTSSDDTPSLVLRLIALASVSDKFLDWPALWTTYEAIIALPKGSSHIPNKTLRRMWQWLGRRYIPHDHPAWVEACYVLGSNMVAAGQTLALSEELCYIKAIFRKGKKSEAIDRWRRQMVAGASTKRPWYNLGIMMLASSGELEGAETLFATMKREGIQRNEHSWKPYIIALNKSGRSGDAFEAFCEFNRDVSDATSASYYSMMNSFLHVGAIHHAHEVFVAMRGKGHKPDDATVMLLLRQTNQDSPTSIDQKTKVIQEHMESTGTTLSEDPEFYLTALKFFIGVRQPTRAVQILDTMRKRNVTISAAHVNLIIKMYLQQHDLQNALEWFQRMNNATGTTDRHGLEEYPLPDMESYALFIEEVSQRKFPMPPGRGSRLDFIINWTRAMSEARIPFTTRVVNAVLAAMLRNDQFNDLWKTWKVMVGERGVVPDIGTYSILWVSQVHVSWHGHKAWPKEIMLPREFFRLMLHHSSVAPTVRTYDLILKTFLRLGDTAGAIVALGVMADRQTINADQGTIAAVAYGIGRKSVVARGIWYEDGVRSMVTTLGLLPDKDQDHNHVMLKRNNEGIELGAKDIQLFLMRTFSKKLGRIEAEEIVHRAAMEMEVAGIRLNWQNV